MKYLPSAQSGRSFGYQVFTLLQNYSLRTVLQFDQKLAIMRRVAVFAQHHVTGQCFVQFGINFFPIFLRLEENGFLCVFRNFDFSNIYERKFAESAIKTFSMRARRNAIRYVNLDGYFKEPLSSIVCSNIFICDS